MSRSEEILAYWFGPSEPPADAARFKERGQMWFMRNAAIDAHIRATFGGDVEAAARGDYASWADTARGRLALIVLLDQFPRNLNRNSPLAFANDTKARELSFDGVEKRMDVELATLERLVFYLPMMHSEDRGMQARSAECYRRLREEAPAHLRELLKDTVGFAERHKYIIDTYGRFPHRNEALGRPSTAEELAFLKEPNSSF